MRYAKGQTATLVGEFRNSAGVLTSPTAVTLRVLPAGGDEVSYEWPSGDVTNPSAGRFEIEIVLSATGRWFARWEGTGAVKAATLDQELVVAESRFT